MRPLMRARGWWLAAFLMIASTAFAEPKPKAVDIKSFRDKLVVLKDADGGTYVVLPGDGARVWYGIPKKPLYEQKVTGRSANGDKWGISVWAPRVSNFQPGGVNFNGDGNYIRYCGDNEQIPLTQVTSDQAKTVLDKSSFMSSAFIRRPYLLARDNSGVYYYVDVIRDEYGGNGYRVFVGKKGAMKSKPMTDIASDTAGDVFSTKTGDLRFVKDLDDSSKVTTTWIKGGKETKLVSLDVEANSRMIFREFGIYGFTGSICENY